VQAAVEHFCTWSMQYFSIELPRGDLCWLWCARVRSCCGYTMGIVGVAVVLVDGLGSSDDVSYYAQ
jgi:hypothetical protein